jgi:thiosulfate/3-mercaptopyruvate sulfurtransferase
MRDLVKAKTEARATTITVIDARPNAQYTGKEAGKEIKRAGHIPGAVSVYWMQNVVGADNPVLRPARKLLALYSKAGAKPGHPTVTYCRSGVQASHTYFTAKYLGYDARLYDGSFLEWSAAKDTPVKMGKKP